MHTTLDKKTKNILAATGNLSVEEYIRKNKSSSILKKRAELQYLFTFYYPYTFYEWKVTVPRYMFKDARSLIRVGVNGITGVAAQTELWPEAQFVDVDTEFLLKVNITTELADKGCRRSLENFVYKAMRPMKPPIYELNRNATIWLPYFVFVEKKGNGNEHHLVLEALTSTSVEVKKMHEVKGWLNQKIEGSQRINK
jgi:hypothetical protein